MSTFTIPLIHKTNVYPADVKRTQEKIVLSSFFIGQVYGVGDVWNFYDVSKFPSSVVAS